MVPAGSAAPALLGVERSLRGKRWEDRCGDERRALALSQMLEAPEIVGRVLAARGVTPEGAVFHMKPTLRESLPDPSSLADMERAADRLADAVQGGERVGIFGDYDVDGATGSALIRRYLEAVGGSVITYIPDRRREGYGPNVPAFRRLAEAGARVIVTVDCGATAFEPLAAAADDGLEVIVVDHHQMGAERPRCAALVNPNRLDDTSGQSALAAVGVAFLLMVGLNRTLRVRGHFSTGGEPDLLRLLDLVALGTICDMAPLTGLNRTLVRQGLRVMAGRENAGLAALADIAGLDTAPTARHAGFALGPRINAGGRIGKADLGHRLLCTHEREEAEALAKELDRLNRERREIESRALAAAEAAAEAVLEDTPAALVIDGDWHIGVIGLVANRLVERHGRPAIVLTRDGGDGSALKGSARSIAGFDIGAAVLAARGEGLVAEGGGHAMAAGMTVARENLAAFTKHICERAAAADPPAPALKIDGCLAPRGAGGDLVALLEAAGPYGIGYPPPRFAFPGCRVTSAARVGDGHVRCRLAGSGGGAVDGMAFRCADRPLGQALLTSRGAALHVAGQLYRERRRGVRLTVEDASPAG